MYNEEEYFPYTNNYKTKIKQMEQQTNTTIKATLDGNLQIDENALYFIDFSKMTRIEDLILILASIGFTFSPKHPHFELLKQFMDINNPIYPNKPEPQQHEIKLPKLTPIKKDGE